MTKKRNKNIRVIVTVIEEGVPPNKKKKNKKRRRRRYISYGTVVQSPNVNY